MSLVYHGEPEAVLADPGRTAAGEVVLFLPPAFELPDTLRLLADPAEHVAPAPGGKPAR